MSDSNHCQLVSSHGVILCHSVAFVLCVFSFCETENFYVSTREHLKQREKNKTKSNVNKDMRKKV